MGLRRVESEVQMLLAETIVALCRNSLDFSSHVIVEGLMAVTMDSNEIFLLNIKETIQREKIYHATAVKDLTCKDNTRPLSDVTDSDLCSLNETVRPMTPNVEHPLHQCNSKPEANVEEITQNRPFAEELKPKPEVPECRSDTNENDSTRKRRRKRNHPQHIVDADNTIDLDSDSECLNLASDSNECVKMPVVIKTEVNSDAEYEITDNRETDIATDLTIKQEKSDSYSQFTDHIATATSDADILLHSFANLNDIVSNNNHNHSMEFYTNQLLLQNYAALHASQGLYLPQQTAKNSVECPAAKKQESRKRRPDSHQSCSFKSPEARDSLQRGPGTPAPQHQLPGAPEDSPDQQRTCPLCHKMFPSRSHRAVHLRTHTGERPFKCPLCGKDFNQRQVMYRHMRNIHHVHPDSTRTYMNRRRAHGPYPGVSPFQSNPQQSQGTPQSRSTPHSTPHPQGTSQGSPQCQNVAESPSTPQLPSS